MKNGEMNWGKAHFDAGSRSIMDLQLVRHMFLRCRIHVARYYHFALDGEYDIGRG
jgi:hypothetical protein